MRVSEAISMLTRHYKPEDEIIIAWWDREWVDADVEGESLTDDQWTELVEHFDDNGDNLGEQMSYDIRNALRVIEPATNKQETA